jgi:type II secretory pathway pseudopilin PulG
VVAIIGILAAIAIPNLLAAQRRSKNSRSATDSKQIVTQAQLYINDNNTMPQAAKMPGVLWNQAAPGSTVYMAATYDPWASLAGQNYLYSEDNSTNALTGEIRAWSRGGNAADDSYGSDDIGYSNFSGGLNN